MLLFIGRDEFRIKCSTYEKENLDLSERVSKVVFLMILSSNAMCFFFSKNIVKKIFVAENCFAKDSKTFSKTV